MAKMTQEDYRKERERVRATYGDTHRETLARGDQALVQLYMRTGWTQEELAEVEKVSQSMIDKRLRFGRFINFSTQGTNGTQCTKELSESTFRKTYWERTNKDADERTRFEEIRTMLAEHDNQHATRRNYKKIALALKKGFGDGKLHSLITITKALSDIAPADLRWVLDMMCNNGLYKVYGEKHKAGNSWNYRLVVHEGTRIKHLEVFLKELQPILDGLEEEGKKNQATAVPAAVAEYAFKLKKLIEKLAQ